MSQRLNNTCRHKPNNTCCAIGTGCFACEDCLCANCNRCYVQHCSCDICAECDTYICDNDWYEVCEKCDELFCSCCFSYHVCN